MAGGSASTGERIDLGPGYGGATIPRTSIYEGNTALKSYWEKQKTKGFDVSTPGTKPLKTQAVNAKLRAVSHRDIQTYGS